ncbi:hypothetical protein [Polymorphospora sp. NPDC050346]|uniref:hypothetical protein n=1 Tax=Polymorphospora sp. NPDC050346 TaxID=3155780 RepID=UPI0033E7743F
MTRDQNTHEGIPAQRRPVRHRRHRPNSQGRARDAGGKTISLSYDSKEFAAVEAAAFQAGLTPTSFVAAAALAVARQSVARTDSALRDQLAELNTARTLVGRFGVNVNQAVAALHSTGAVPAELVRATELCARAVERLDDIVIRLRRRLP